MADDLQRWLALLPAALRGDAWPADPPLGGLALLSADADRIQQFVFQSARLPEIRGASARLDRLNRPLGPLPNPLPQREGARGALPGSQGAQNLFDVLAAHGLPTTSITAEPPGCIVFAGGGSLMAVVPLRLAPVLAAEMEALYPRHTDVATLTAVWQKVTPDDLAGHVPAGLTAASVAALEGKLDKDGRARLRAAYGLKPDQPLDGDAFDRAQGIDRVVGEQTRRLQQRKRAKESAPLVEADPFARRCRSCGRRPAATTLTGLAGEPPRYLCRVCAENGRVGGKGKSFWNADFEAWYRQNKRAPLGSTYAEDLNAIGQRSAKPGYIGYIYADGNRVGRLLEESRSLDDYAHKSQALSAAMTTAVFRALAEPLRDRQGIRPFEIITIGGDDALLIVPADAALPVAVALCRAFNEELAANPDLRPTPTMSAGVVLAHDSNPITFLRDLADQLLRSAKQGTERSEQGCIDFMILKSQSTLATRLEDVRASDYLRVVNHRAKECCYLTGRPYTLDDTARLLDGARRLADARLAPSQIYRLREDLQKGRLPGLFQYLYQRARLRPPARAALAAVEAEWQLAAPNPTPWRPYPAGRPADAPAAGDYLEVDTPLLDLLALREFVPEAQDAH